MQPARVEAGPEDQIVKLHRSRIREQRVLQTGFTELPFEGQFESVLRALDRFATCVAMDPNAGSHGERGCAVRQDHFHRTLFDHRWLLLARVRIESVSAKHVASLQNEAKQVGGIRAKACSVAAQYSKMKQQAQHAAQQNRESDAFSVDMNTDPLAPPVKIPPSAL